MDSLKNVFDVGSALYGWAKRHMSLDEDVDNLKRKRDELESQEVDVITKLRNEELLYKKKTKKTVENWLTNVGKMKEEVKTVEVNLNRGLFGRVMRVSQVAKCTREVDELLKKGKFRRGLTLNTHHTTGLHLWTKPLVGKAFEENLVKVWGYLMEPEVLTIGIWGMGGVGKTTLMMEINNRARQHDRIFDDVCWITVSQSLDIYKLQDQLAKAVNLEFDEKDLMIRASILYNMLENRRCLFILDDAWRAFELKEVGIPVKVNGCKVIITTRSQDVCDRLVCEKKIKVEPLSEEEAWGLFEKNLGNGVTLSPQVLEVALCVARECAGLPLGIVTMASCMRGVTDLREWRYAFRALRELKNDGLDDMKDKVFDVLEFSYNRLRDPNVQQSFLYCALYPEDHKIGKVDLIQRLIDEGIVERMESRQAQFDKGHVMLNKLVNSSLLEVVFSLRSGKDEECVKMHDLLRDMAIKMTSSQFMAKAGIHLGNLPDEQEWPRDVMRVSLMHNKMKELVTSPMRPNLSTLLLSDNTYLERIDNSFFQHMPALKILDLSNCQQIVELPDSVSSLKNLNALVLCGCSSLKGMPSLADLKSLKRLDLGFTSIRQVPHGLEKLVKLTYLDLRAQHLDAFPTGILPQLLLLEVLMFPCIGHKVVKIKGEELKSLERLSTFQGNLGSGFQLYVKSRKPHRGPNCSYCFSLNGRGKHATEEFILDDNLNSVRVEGFNFSNRGVEPNVDVETLKALLNDVQSLELWGCYGAQNLCDVLSGLDSAAHNLKWCRLWNFKGITCLVPCSRSPPYFLQKLEKLELCSLDNLESLFESGGEFEGAFSCLQVLRLYSCSKIKKLFQPAFLPNLGNLQEIRLDKCEALEEIIGASDGEISTRHEYALPNLKTLSLYDLPQLNSICALTISCASLCEIIVVSCPQLKRMPLTKLSASCQSISIHPMEWWELAKWDRPYDKYRLRSSLKVFDSEEYNKRKRQF